MSITKNQNKFTPSFLVKLSFIGVAIILVIATIATFVSFSNQEIELRSAFEQKIDERTTFYDKMFKIISQQTQIAVKNDESFRQNINIIMEGRKDSQGLFMKWIQETNPNANYSEVSVLYRDLSRSIEAQREGFFNQEKVIQDIVRQHKLHIQKFPNSFINSFVGRQPLEYKLIQSSITQEVMRTGEDNHITLDL